MKKREFKIGDTVYWGTLKGKVTIIKEGSTYPVVVEFEDISNDFTENGQFYKDTPQVLFHQPYNLSFIEPTIEKDTKVWYRDGDFENWGVGYYSHYNSEDDMHVIFDNSKKSTQTNNTTGWAIVVTEDPLN